MWTDEGAKSGLRSEWRAPPTISTSLYYYQFHCVPSHAAEQTNGWGWVVLCVLFNFLFRPWTLLILLSTICCSKFDCIFNFPNKRDKARSIIIINCVAQESEIKCVRRCHRDFVQLFQKFTTMAISGLVFCNGRRAIFSSAFSFRSAFIVSISGGFSFLFYFFIIFA